MTLKENLINKIKTFKLKQYVMRVLMSYAFSLLCSLLVSGKECTQKSFFYGINLPLFVFFTAAVFVLSCFIKSEKIINGALIAFAEMYFALASALTGEYMFSFGLCLIICIAAAFADIDEIKISIKKNTLAFFCVTLIVCYTVFIGGICCLYYLNYKTPCYDFGLFSQMFYYMKETGECLVTCERDGLLSHFAVHFSPVYYLLLPVYFVFPSPCTLLIAQAFVVASGIIPLTLICRKYGLSNASAAVFSCCYILFPSFMGGCFWYLHENCFLGVFILFLIYFMEKEKTLPAFIFVFLTLSVKEDAAVYTAVIALYFLFANKNYKCNLSVFAVSVLYFCAVTKLMSIYGEGIMSQSRYGIYIYDGGGLLTVIKSVIGNPVYAVYNVFRQEKLPFILQMLVPLCFLPLLIKKPQKLILLIPFVLINLMTDYVYQYDIGFQYTFGTGSILFYLAAGNAAEAGKHSKKILLCGLLSSLIIFSGGYLSKISYINTFSAAKAQREAIAEGLEMIPDDAEVAASTFFVANLSQRREVYELETTKHETDYIAVDLRSEEGEERAQKYFGGDYECIYYRSGAAAVFKSFDGE